MFSVSFDSTASAIAQQSTDAARGPQESSVCDNGKTPVRSTRRAVGLKPVNPQNAAGIRIDPPVSEPSAHTAIPVATDTAPPDVDPPTTRRSSNGLAGRAVMRVQTQRRERELHHIGTAEQDRARGAEPRDDRCVGRGRRSACQQLRSRGSHFAFDIEEVFDRNGQSGEERRHVAGCARCVAGGGRVPRAIRINLYVRRSTSAAMFINPRDRLFHERRAAGARGFEIARELSDRFHLHSTRDNSNVTVWNARGRMNDEAGARALALLPGPAMTR